ncbi:MAG: pyridoxamine 5'-phosphate oxidase family protein [Planctomycetaceae bacterium]
MNGPMGSTTSQDIQHLAELIKGIRIAMITTVCKDGSLRSRPMATQEPDFDGTLWFFTSADSAKAGEVEEEGQVNVTYEDSDASIYVSISGRATLVLDRQKIEELWNQDVAPWFPGGVHDPQLALLRVDADKWEYWDCQSGVMVQRSGQLKETATEAVHQQRNQQGSDLAGVWVSQDVGTAKNRNEIP